MVFWGRFNGKREKRELWIKIRKKHQNILYLINK